MRKIICPKCKGKKTVFNKVSLLLTIGLIPALLLDDDSDERCVTRERCPHCNGKGSIEI